MQICHRRFHLLNNEFDRLIRLGLCRYLHCLVVCAGKTSSSVHPALFSVDLPPSIDALTIVSRNSRGEAESDGHCKGARGKTVRDVAWRWEEGEVLSWPSQRGLGRLRLFDLCSWKYHRVSKRQAESGHATVSGELHVSGPVASAQSLNLI